MNDGDEAHTKLAVTQNDLGYIKEKLNTIDKKVNTEYITKNEFEPVKQIVYGLVSLILVAVVGAILALVMKPNGKAPVDSGASESAIIIRSDSII